LLPSQFSLQVPWPLPELPASHRLLKLKKSGTSADTTVTANSSVKVGDMIAALKEKGFGAKVKG